MNLTLERRFYGPKYIIGKMSVNGLDFCDTLERPLKDDKGMENQQDVTCIPSGTYEVKMMFSPKFQRPMPHVLTVPNRTDIEIHDGNRVEDSKGCIILGNNTEEGVLTDSRFTSDTFNNLLKAVTGDIVLFIC